MGLAQAMFAVQEQLPSLLKGNPIHAPSTLVHEMFSKYSNGTKTEADLASIDKGLDELFFHDFSAEDNERLVDFIGAGDLFNQETITIQPPQLVRSFWRRGEEREMPSAKREKERKRASKRDKGDRGKRPERPAAASDKEGTLGSCSRPLSLLPRSSVDPSASQRELFMVVERK